jgi:hypothetical protein
MQFQPTPRCRCRLPPPPKGFLLLLSTPTLRDRGLSIDRVMLQLIPWTCMAGAEAAKLSFKVRIFIEGILHHAR